jgi:phage replication-related protein YjqB (UPF0714/DUF867 family)
MSRTTVFRTQSTDNRISRRAFGAGMAGMAAITTFASTCANVALAGNEVQTVPTPFSIPVEISGALKSQSINGDRWACSVSGDIAEIVGLGEQIRICRNNDNCAVYTITEIVEGDGSDQVRLGKAARERLGTSATGFDATVRQALAAAKLSDKSAKNASEFIETIDDSGNHQGLLVMAPHGGNIEINTDRQARRVADLLSGHDVSTWCCKGWKSGGGAWDRWHVTSTMVSPKSFPGLAKVTKRSYAYSVAFHGMKDSGVLIGGRGPKQLKEMLRQEIKAALGGAAGPVTIASKDNDKGGYSLANVANWVTAGGSGGIQIEQSSKVRDQYWNDVAAAVASVFSGLV